MINSLSQKVSYNSSSLVISQLQNHSGSSEMLEGCQGDEETGLQPFAPTPARDLFIFWERTADPVEAPHCTHHTWLGKSHIVSCTDLKVMALLFLLHQCLSYSASIFSSKNQTNKQKKWVVSLTSNMRKVLGPKTGIEELHPYMWNLQAWFISKSPAVAPSFFLSYLPLPLFLL